jgi:hypothetical protein
VVALTVQSTTPRATTTAGSSQTVAVAVPGSTSPILPPPQTSTESGLTSQSDIGTQVSGTMPNGGVPGQQLSLPPQNVNTEDNTHQPPGSQGVATTTVRESQPPGGGPGSVVNVDGAASVFSLSCHAFTSNLECIPVKIKR